MKELLQTHTSDYTLQSGIDQLHAEVTEWLSELSFYKTELNFLNKLLDKAFLRVSGDQKVNELNALAKRIRIMGTRSINKTQSKTILHEHQLSQLNKTQFKQNEQLTREEHKQILAELKLFIAEIKELKKEIFTVIERQMKQIRKISSDYENGNLVL